MIDVLNTPSVSERAATEFFVTTTGNLQRVGAEAGVGHLVTLSILGLERVPGYGYYRAKLAQERAARSGPLPASVLRAAQFHEFAGQMVARTRRGRFAVVPRMRSQPVAARTVAERLVDLATRPPGDRRSLAGPEVHDIAVLARQLIAARREGVRVIPLPVPGASGRAMRGGALLADEQTEIAGPSFAEWLHSPDAAEVPLRR